MNKITTDAEQVLKQIGDLSSYLAGIDRNTDVEECFTVPLEIMQKTMGFDVSVLYKITNCVDNSLLLRVKKVLDPEHYRTDLIENKRLQLKLDDPDPLFINEVQCYKTKSISLINVPNAGCDIMGFVYLPKSLGEGYLFGGDFCGKESLVQDYEASVCEIICNMLSTIFFKTEFETLAVFDHLTGLYNSGKIKEEVERICSRLDRKSGTQTSIVMCDIDHFKKINDTYGHIQGDIILRELGRILSSSMREYFDIAGRYGGEEFLLIFEETALESAFEIAERLRKRIKKNRFTKVDSGGNPIENQFLNITMSFGIAQNRKDIPCTGREWISRADEALYKSKKQGRDRVTI